MTVSCSDVQEDLSAFAECVESAILRDTQYNVHVVLKEHEHFVVSLLRQGAPLAADGSQHLSTEFTREGNCTPAAIARINGNHETLRKELKKSGLGGVHNTKAKAEKSRVYAKCQKLLGVHLMPCVSPVLQVGSYLLHHEPFGKPHCDGLIVRADGTHALHTSEGRREVSSTAFIETWYSALDKRSLVAFKLMGAPMAETDPLHRRSAARRRSQPGAP